MNNKVSKLCSEAAEGNFKSVNITLRSKEFELDNASAAKVVIECCRVFVKNKSTININEEDLLELLITCVQSIENISDDAALRYMQSVFFIVNYFFKQGNFEFILQLENVLLPKFMDPVNNEKLKKTFGSICDLVHNAIAKVSTSEATERNNEVYVYLCMLSLKMHHIRFPTMVQLVDKGKTYFKSLKFCDADIELQYNCFLGLLQLVDEQSSDAYIAIVKILDSALIRLLKERKFSKIREYFGSALTKLTSVCGTKEYQQLHRILCSANQFTVELMENQGNSDLLMKNYEVCSKELQLFCNTYGLRAEIQKTSILVYAILSNLIQYYGAVTPVVWNACMTEKTQIALYKLLGVIGYIATKTPIKCPFCPSCEVQTNLHLGSSIINLVGDLLKMCIVKQTTLPYLVVLQALNYLERCCTLVSNLQSQGCAGWKSAWTNVGITVYNVAVKLYTIKHSKCNKYWSLLIRHIIKLEGSAIFEFDVLSISLSCLTEIYIESGRFRKALTFAAIQVLLCPDSKPFKQWIRIKAKDRQSATESADLQHLTVICVLEQSKPDIEKFCPELDVNLDAQAKINLLLAELAQCKSMWASSVPMVAAFKKLYAIADAYTTVKVLIQTWGDMIYIPRDIFDIVDEIFPRFESETELDKKDEGVEKQITKASLYTIKYHIQTMKIREAVTDSINNTVACSETILLPHEVPKHPNDECDLVPSYVNLRLNECMETTNFLSRALSILDTSISNSASSYIIEVLQKYNLFGIVANVASEFQLHCDSLQATRACFICLRIAKLLENDLYMLQSISCLIENSSMNCVVVNELLTEAERLLSKLNAMESAEAWKTIAAFHISKSTMLLHNQKVQAGYEEYKKALEIFEKIPEGSSNQLLKLQLEFLHVQYLQLPCSFEIEDHYANSLEKFSRVLNQITSYVKNQGNTTSLEKATLFKINQSVVHMYTWMCLPREVRCYCRDIVKYAQQLAIPLRTAFFLIYLANADLQSSRLDDCQVKLNGLSDILCLGNKTSTPLQNEIIKETALIADEDVADLTDNFSEIMLDCLPVPSKLRISPGSPLLYAEPFKLPSFMNHSCECDCFYCMSVEYKNLVLMYINLEGQLNVHRGNMAGAQACYNGALRLYRHINVRSNKYKKNVSTILSCFPFRDLKENIALTYCALLLSYGQFLLLKNHLNKAESVHKDLLKVISERKYENTHLYSAALIQYMITMQSSCRENEDSKQKYSQIDTNLLMVETNDQPPKTPENNKSKVVFPNCFSPKPESPPKRRMRRVKCDFSETKVESNIKIPFTIHTSPMAEGKRNKAEGSESAKCKTPAAATSAPCVPPAVKTSKKNKLIFQQISVPSSSQNEASGNASELESFVIPQSPNAYTPNSLKVSTALQTRTKMLTRKIKKSTVKKAATNNAEECNTDSRTIDTKNVRKNLMSELCVAASCENTLMKNERQKPRSTIKEKTDKGGRSLRSRTKNK